MKMNKQIAKLWANALRSGRFKQGRGGLAKMVGDNPSYCCLGVLCELAIENGVKVEKRTDDYLICYDDDCTLLPQSVASWAETIPNPILLGKGATRLNDILGFSFAEIADRIELQFLGEE
jgi:hypothetical protein